MTDKDMLRPIERKPPVSRSNGERESLVELPRAYRTRVLQDQENLFAEEEKPAARKYQKTRGTLEIKIRPIMSASRYTPIPVDTKAALSHPPIFPVLKGWCGCRRSRQLLNQKQDRGPTPRDIDTGPLDYRPFSRFAAFFSAMVFDGFFLASFFLS